MNQFQQWCAMGGYASYVWSAYGLVGMILLINVLGVRVQGLRIRQTLKKWIKRQAL